MPVPGSLLLYLPLAILIVAAAAAMGYVVYLLARGRRTPGATPAAGSTSADESANELRALRTAIETLVDQQQVQGETHRQQVNQRLERVGHRMDEVGHQVDGLRNELRHEVRRRDAEISEIRQQIEAIAQRTGAPMLSPGTPSFAVLSEASTPPAEPASVQAAAAPEEPGAPEAFQAPGQTEVQPEATEAAADWFSLPPLGDAVAPPLRFPTSTAPEAHASMGARADAEAQSEPEAERSSDTDASEPFPPAAVLPPAQLAFSGEAPEPTLPPAPEPAPRLETPLRLVEREPVRRTPRRSIFVPMDDFFGTPPAPASAAPENADDLTVISSIDDELQQRLYAAGVTSLEEMAHWGRADARRFASALGVAEETIMNQWIFEAQAALYERYARPGAF